MSKLTFGGFFAFILLGCAGNDLKPTIVYTPHINDIATSEVGQNMFEKIYAVYPSDKGVEIIANNETAKHFLKMNDTKKFYLTKDKEGQCVLQNQRGLDMLYDSNCDGNFTETIYLDSKLDNPIQYKVVPPVPSKILGDSFKREVLYQGKNDNKLNIAFREYIEHRNDFIIRDAYTQNIQYELDKNGQAEIGFKGLRIQVIKATNFDITYKVLKDYSN